LALSSTVGMWFAERAVVTLRIGEPGTLWRGPIPFVLGAVGEVVYGLPFAALLVGGLDPLTGRTPGKRLVGLRVRRADGAPAELPRRASRWAIQAVGFWGWTLALIAGRWEIAALATAAVAIVIAGMLAALGPHSRALHDRASGTVVVRSR
jgi:uncharacterized RDD family membrane protein YckC